MLEFEGKDSNGWILWRNHVLTELTRYNSELVELRKDVQDLKVSVASDVSSLKTKSSIWMLHSE